MKVYLIGSLSNQNIPKLANLIEEAGHKVFADWYSPGPDADTFWREYEQERGREFVAALNGPHAQQVFDLDKRWLDWCEVGILALPAGRSAHLELGYLIGGGKRGYILLEEPNPARWDVMYRFTGGVTHDFDLLLKWIDC
jgi:hypothetical protein